MASLVSWRNVLLVAVCVLPVGAQAQQGKSAADVLARVSGAEAKAQRLAARLEACRTAGHNIVYPDASLAVAELFCRYSRYDANQPALRETAIRSMDYVERMIDAELRKADEVLAGRAEYPAIPPWRSAVGVRWHDGGFWVGDEPLFLSGFNWDAAAVGRDPALLKRLGVNLVDGMLPGGVNRDGSFNDDQYNRSQGAYLRRMGEAGFPVDCMYGIGLPRWLIDAGLACRGYGNGCDYVIDDPRAAEYRAKVLDHIIPLNSAERSFFAVDLANEPAFQGPSELMVENWRKWLKRKYGTLDNLNRVWGTHLESFEAIHRYPSRPEKMNGPWDRGRVDFGQPGIRGMHYDWCAFNNERISDYFASVSQRIHAKAPQVATHVKVMMGLYFTGSTEARGWRMDLSYHTFGIDPEALAHSCSLLGCDVDLYDLSDVAKPNRRYGSVPYIMGWLDAGMTADFMKSLAPEKPFYNSEFHVTEDNKVMADPAGAKAHIETALWLAHLHGMSANLAWYWSRNSEGAMTGAEWSKGSLLQQPWMLQGYAQETLSLRRFVRPVMAFARQPRPVRLLYSEASAIQDVRYLDALRDAYEALNFLGVSIGFLTERQLADGGVPADTRLMIIPNARYVEDRTVSALRAAKEKGLMVGIIGEKSLTAEPTGGARSDARVPGAERIGLGSPQEHHRQFDGWLKAAGVDRELLALDADGRPAWGVEVRTASEGERRLAYLVNLMRQPVKVRLQWRAANAQLRDWRSDATVGGDLTLNPRQVIFGGY